MTTHSKVEATKTRCGKWDTLDRLSKGLSYIPPRIKTDDWTQVDCKACLKTYHYPVSRRLPNGKYSNTGFTTRITK